jgi:hypothetical protein
VAIFEGEFGDAEVAEAFGNHAMVLFLCGARERHIARKFALLRFAVLTRVHHGGAPRPSLGVRFHF